MHNDGPFESRLEGVLLPSVVFVVHLVSLEDLLVLLQLSHLLLVLRSMGLHFGGTFRLVLKVEADRQLEVALNGSALVRPLQRVKDLDVDLGAVEGAISVVEFPGLAELVQCFFKGRLGCVPQFVGTQTDSRPGGKFKLKGETEVAVDIFQEIQHAHHFVGEGLGSAEQMGVVLLETTHTGEAGQSTRDFVSVKNAEVRKA